ncbi:MAG: hypothetical protein A4E28_00057 [Methanocella sp. PtaU1.Bin125]|nr:MAG: hypothetical protein A4E28_00057 [Methanocella sp. PtaU1.Bin125]
MSYMKRFLTNAVISIAGVLLALFVLWVLLISCCAFHRPPNDLNAPPDHYYRYNLTDNGTIDHVTIKSFFTFTYNNDVRFIETVGDDIEVKLWGKFMMPAVEFNKNGTDLTLDINVNCGIDNDMGTPYANEYIYLPKNCSYTIISENENGHIQVGNKSWNYTEMNNNMYGRMG